MSTDIYISKIKPRRGTDDQRRHVVFDQGELIHTLDTKRLYVGNGVLSGGVATSNKFHPPLANYYSLSTLKAEIGDVVAVDSLFYQLTASPYTDVTNWGNVSIKFDSEFSYDEQSVISVALSGLSANKLDPDSISNGITIRDATLQLDYDTSYFDISSNNKLFIKNGGITETEILSSSLAVGLSGGNGGKIGLKVDPTHFTYTGTGSLTLTGAVLSAEGNKIFPNITNTYELTGLDSERGDLAVVGNQFYQLTSVLPSVIDDWYRIDQGSGSVFHPSVSTYEALSGITAATAGDFTMVNSRTYRLLGGSPTNLTNWIQLGTQTSEPLYIDDNGIISLSGVALSSYPLSASPQLSSAHVVYDALSCKNTLNSSNVLSALFNGSPTQLVDGRIPNLEITRFEAVSSNGVTTTTLTLSSGGFITIEDSMTTVTGKTIDRFAIPIFTF